jgi:EAL domain-containing protein (putative c-di-GMP-specific phosphodiesterase class I)
LFVANIGSPGGNETITSSIIALAHSLELQRFFFSPPLPAGEIRALLLNGRTSRRPGVHQSPSDQSRAGNARGRRSLSVAT